MTTSPTQINGIRDMIYHMINNDYDRARTSIEPVIKEKIKIRYQQTVQNMLAKEHK